MSEGGSSEEDYYGPSLPPHLMQTKENLEKIEEIVAVSPPPSEVKNAAIGPTLPPGFIFHPTEAVTIPEDVPSSEEEEDAEDVIGPLPPDHPLARARANSASIPKSTKDKDKKLQREEWMLIPPSNKPVTELGLGPRKFLQRAPAAPVKDNGEPMGDSDEEFEKQIKAEMDQKIIEEYDKSMESMIDKSKVKRKTESLLEMHQKDMKKKAKKEKEEQKRKPFDRNTDLSVSGLSKEDSKKYVEKTRELSGRFHKGRQKFL